MTGAPCGIVWWSSEKASHVSPGEPDVARVELLADLVEGQRALPDEPAVDPRRQRAFAVPAEAAAEEGPADHDTEQGDRDGHGGLQPDRAVGDEEREQTGRERTDGQEDGKERRARKLEHKQRQRCDEPDP